MRIRTDFVTNSSSYNTVEVIIDNPVLLEILQKYKDMGLFGDNDPIIGIGIYESTCRLGIPYHNGGDIRTPAFYYFESEVDGEPGLHLSYGAPNSLEAVLGYIISLMDDGEEYLDANVFAQLEDELSQRKDEINSAYSSVSWENQQFGDDGTIEYDFNFDPVNGEHYKVEER